MSKKPMTSRNVRVSDSLWAAAKAAAEANQENISDVIRRALSNYAQTNKR
ncbi:hypothetical protein [Microbacterium oleivorans]|uniref:Ribbon-helix-helix protein CopG domain-containing protein n=1 Tax=Microbacterium oleivorans TaxID=273677 RepID=A0A7D5IP68_9MICO|nr:hypothetical protein [Microbacterium oleivorans]QLD11379.1 hypothetical protein HW566_06075 [Microbacterium oleivorans]